MPKFARVFNKLNAMAFDVPLQVEFGAYIFSIRTDGFVLGPGVFVPYDMVAMILEIENSQMPGTIVHLVPPTQPDKPA